MKTKILITGVAGFIGFNVARKLLNLNYNLPSALDVEIISRKIIKIMKI
jgi:nucleoside-diphosphate-sugar epimerase